MWFISITTEYFEKLVSRIQGKGGSHLGAPHTKVGPCDSDISYGNLINSTACLFYSDLIDFIVLPISAIRRM